MWNVTIINPVRTTCVYTLTLYSSTRSCQDKDAKGRASEAKAPRYNILVSSSTVEQCYSGAQGNCTHHGWLGYRVTGVGLHNRASPPRVRIYQEPRCCRDQITAALAQAQGLLPVVVAIRRSQ